jgi:ribonuclease P protein component
VLDRQPGSGARLGLAVSRKHARLAVTRSRLKRLIRESFRTHRPALADRDVVVLPRVAAVSADAAALRRSLDALWAALGTRA